ncbi:hypothetical protein BCR44DRAFT_1437561 [Catenaria anguillulae PL171]|uniref:Uncharacterized protein n=1 Tax=Catenaria anguillulae PL171 TaxID=765915 RepID=A0A1Y2HGQ6_9FUNG|nr:hypothetical protein BCR44DRAFT_1437561 [Catenaria anguillulae PL171]
MAAQQQEQDQQQAAPAEYRPTDHGMVTDTFLADFLDALPSDSDSDSDTDSGNRETLASRPAYTAQIASPLHSFLLPFLASQSPPSLGHIVHTQLLSNPLGPTSIRATIDYLYFHKLFHTCERRITTCKDPAQTGLMCAYQLKDEGMMVRNWVELAKVGSTLDPHARYLLGSVHMHFQSGPVVGELAGERVGVEEVAEQLRLAVEVKSSDVHVWIVVRELFANAAWVKDRGLGLRVAQLAQVRALSILDVAKVDWADTAAKRRWESMVAKVESGFVMPQMPNLDTAIKVSLDKADQESNLLFPPPHHPLMHAVPHYSAMHMSAQQVEDALSEWCAEVQAWTFVSHEPKGNEQVGESLAALIKLVYKETFRHVARRVCPGVWAMGRAGVVVVPGIPVGASGTGSMESKEGSEEGEEDDGENMGPFLALLH